MYIIQQEQQDTHCHDQLLEQHQKKPGNEQPGQKHGIQQFLNSSVLDFIETQLRVREERQKGRREKVVQRVEDVRRKTRRSMY